jgi:hypothetical protein
VRRILPVLLALLPLVVQAAAEARADGLSEKDRREVERRFAEGRYDLVDVELSGVDDEGDLFAGRLLHGWWRKPVESVSTGVGVEFGPWSARLAWTLVPTPDPPPGLPEGTAERWPVLLALVLDRQRRESLGITGLPMESPLEAVAKTLDEKAEEKLLWLLTDRQRWLLSVCYRLMPPDEHEVRAREESEGLARRNGWFALLALAAFLLLPGALLARLLPPRSGGRASG